MERSVAALALGDAPDGDEAWMVARREEVADRAVDLMAVRAWARLPAAAHGPALEACLAYVVSVDADLASGNVADREAPHRLAVRALTELTRAESFDAAIGRARELLGPTAPEGRLAAAWRMADTAVTGLLSTRHEWVDADPAVVAAAGWVLVDRIGRLLAASALVASASVSADPAVADPAVAASDDLRVNAARRYAWNHLRGPAPEAATPTHVLRSAELVRALRDQTPC